MKIDEVELKQFGLGDGNFNDAAQVYEFPLAGGQILLNRDRVDDTTNVMNFGAVIPYNLSPAKDYLEKVKDYEAETSHPDEMNLCRRLYRYEGAVGTSIDTLVELGITDGYVTNCSDELKALLRYWADHVNNLLLDPNTVNPQKKSKGVPELSGKQPGIRHHCESIFHEWLVTGDAVNTENWDTVVMDVEGGPQQIICPYELNLHRIENLRVSDQFASIGREVIYLKIDSKLASMIKNPGNDEEAKLAKDVVSPLIVQAVSQGKDEVPLPAILTTHFKRRGEGDLYGVPYVRKAFTAIASKRRIQALDHATIAGMIQRLTIIMLGTEDVSSPFHSPRPGRVALLKTLLSRTEANKLLIWGGPDIMVKDIGPDGKVLSFEGRFNEADDNISMALGTPRLLIDGSSGGKGSSDWSVFLSTMAKLEGVRSMLARWITDLMRLIAIANGYKDEFPKWEWSPIKLRDERIIKAHTIKAYEDGLISRYDALIDLGFNPDDTISRHLEEVDSGINEILISPKVAFNSPNTGGGGKSPGTPDGRPAGQPNKSKRAPAKASAEDPVMSLYAHVKESVLAQSLMETAKDTLREGFRKIEKLLGHVMMGELETSMSPGRWLEWEHALFAWNNRYLTPFRDEVIAGLETAGTDVRMWLDKFDSRMAMYAEECRAKARVAIQIANLEDQGFSSFKTVVGEQGCDECKKTAGQPQTKKNLFNAFPYHPNDGCQIVGAE